MAICGADKIITEMTTELLIQCQYCNRTFSEEDEVLRHQRTHTTEKNYECVDCQLGFDMYMLAEYHWLKPCTAHSNEFCFPKVILCEVCKMHFVSHHDLYYHKLMMGHHGLKLYVDSVVTSVVSNLLFQSIRVSWLMYNMIFNYFRNVMVSTTLMSLFSQMK